MRHDNSTAWRGDVMRRMAAVRTEMDLLQSVEMSAEERGTRTEELKKQLAALMKKSLT